MKIRTYRIIPFDVSQWRVQRKTLFGWKDVGHLVCGYGECFEIPDNFDTEAQAEYFIDQRLEYERKLTAHQSILPRRYP